MMWQDKIYIIGAGAIGKVLAVFLKLAGKEVIIIRGRNSEEAIAPLRIAVELPDRPVVETEIEVATLSAFRNLNGLILFTNKSFANADLAKAVYGRIDHSPIVILQNGLGVEKAFIDGGFKAVYRCVLFATSQPLSDGKFRFKPVTASPIGVIKGNIDSAEAIVGQLNNSYFPFRSEPDIEPIIWTKTIVNCVFNSICPLLETDNGIFYRNSEAMKLAENIINECVAVASETGVTLRKEEVFHTFLNISRASEGQIISTYMDILNKRKTEIESLNFAITGIADKLDKSRYVKQTRLLGELIKIKTTLSINDTQLNK